MWNGVMDLRTNGRVARNFLAVGLATLLLAACSIKRTAVNIVGDAMAGGGGVLQSEKANLQFETETLSLPGVPVSLTNNRSG